MLRVLTSLAVIGLVAPAVRAETKFDLNGENTKITFVGTKKDGKHDGGFKKVKGAATYDGKDPATLNIAVDIDLESTYTDTEKLTDHLKSPDFFGVKNNPTAKFATTKIERGKDGYQITGKLTLNGKSKEVSFPAKIEAKDGSLSLTSDFKINRFDWGINYDKAKVDEEVSLKIAINAKK